MKSNELRIGNWVQTNNGHVLAISLIDSDPEIIAGHGSSDDYEGLRALGSVKPIKLTEEWLIKFGFTGGQGSLSLGDGRYCYVSLRSIKFAGYIKEGKKIHAPECYDYVSDGEYHHSKLRYVHQLQNLHFALEGTELKTK